MKNKTFLLAGIFCLVLIFSVLSVSKVQAIPPCTTPPCVCNIVTEPCPYGTTVDTDKACDVERTQCCCPPLCPDYCRCLDPPRCPNGESLSDAEKCEDSDKICCCPEVTNGGVNGNGDENGDDNGDENGYGNFIRIQNPLQAAEFEDILDNLINFIFSIAVVLAPLMVVIAGFLFVTAGGNSEQINKAKTMIIWTIIGFLIILLSKGIMGIIMNLLGTG